MIQETDTTPRTRNGHLVTTISTKTRTRFGSWNIRTLREQSRLAQVEDEMKRYKIQLLGLSEVRWLQAGEFQTTNGNIIIHSGSNNEGEHGVGIIIEKSLKNSITERRQVSNRILAIRLHTKIRKISVVQCYAPTEVSIDDKKDEFYAQLTTTLSSIPKKDIIMLMGDFNAKIGNEKVTGVTSNHGMGTRNNNGDRLIEICQEFNLTMGGSMFPHKEIHKYTWTSPDGRTKNQIDHMCISRKWKQTLLDVRSWRGAE